MHKYILPEIYFQNFSHYLGIFKVPFMNSFQPFMILSVPVGICIYEFYSINPSYFSETKIYAKLERKAANTAHSYYLKSGTIYSQQNFLS